MGVVLGLILSALGLTLISSFRILREYERAIVFRLGRARSRALGPGVS